MALKTYGDKPISFQIEEGGEFYCMGSEVSEKFIRKAGKMAKTNRVKQTKKKQQPDNRK